MMRGGRRRGHTEELVVSGLDSLVDCIDQSGEVDGDHNDQSDDRSPVDSAFVSVDTFVLVQHGNMELPVSDEVVVGSLNVSFNSE